MSEQHNTSDRQSRRQHTETQATPHETQAAPNGAGALAWKQPTVYVGVASDDAGLYGKLPIYPELGMIAEQFGPERAQFWLACVARYMGASYGQSAVKRKPLRGDVKAQQAALDKALAESVTIKTVEPDQPDTFKKSLADHPAVIAFVRDRIVEGKGEAAATPAEIARTIDVRFNRLVELLGDTVAADGYKVNKRAGGTTGTAASESVADF